jgi:hypothetical protein
MEPLEDVESFQLDLDFIKLDDAIDFVDGWNRTSGINRIGICCHFHIVIVIYLQITQMLHQISIEQHGEIIAGAVDILSL